MSDNNKIAVAFLYQAADLARRAFHVLDVDTPGPIAIEKARRALKQIESYITSASAAAHRQPTTGYLTLGELVRALDVPHDTVLGLITSGRLVAQDNTDPPTFPLSKARALLGREERG